MEGSEWKALLLLKGISYYTSIYKLNLPAAWCFMGVKGTRVQCLVADAQIVLSLKQADSQVLKPLGHVRMPPG
jgi:hypothetical protein